MTELGRPTRRKVLISGGLAFGAAGLGVFSASPSRASLTSQRSGIAFGTVVSLKARHDDLETLTKALDAAWSEVVEVQQAANLFDASSALSRLNRDGKLSEAPAVLVEMLSAAQNISVLTDGAFDVTVQPLWTLYQSAYNAGRKPSDAEISALSDLVNYRNIEIDGDRVRLMKPHMQVTLNGIAQGYATERCLRALARHGVNDAFLNTGEIGVAGSRDESHLWTAAIADPRHEGQSIALVRPPSGVLATSGDYATTFAPDFSVHHIFDPKTLRSPTKVASASVLAQSGAQADALATAMMVMEPDTSLALAHQLQGVEVFLIDKSGTTRHTDGFPIA